ncbi:MAG: hypothetical protein RLZZ205_1171 [Bacteroidota bacterium]|jgi:outer membrane receptor for ferrienterochelin and colicin
MRTKLFFFLVLLVIASQINAQNSFTLSGTITESGSGELLPGVMVYCVDQQAGTTSNGYGFYVLHLKTIPAQVVFRFLGHKEVQVTVDGDKLRQDIAMELAEVQKELVIEGNKYRNTADQTQMSTIEIPVDQIKKIPALLGEKDVLKVIQLLPGVQKGSEGSSGFYVRGGGPDQNLIILDDAVVYNANHLFGFFSTFNGDALKSVELIKGGFPARYGGRLSSVLNMQMKDGDKQKFKGEAGFGLIASRLMLEGPIAKGKVSYLVSARRTYIDALIYPFLPRDSKSGYYFYDLNGKVNWVVNKNNRIYLSGYTGKDRFYYRPWSEFGDQESAYLQWFNRTATLRWNHIYNDKLFSNTSLIYSKYLFDIGSQTKENGVETFSLSYGSGIQDWTLKHDFDYALSNAHHMKMGVSSIKHHFTPSAIVVKGDFTDENLSAKEEYRSIENGVYIEDEVRVNNQLKFNLGYRLSNFVMKDNVYWGWEPRLNARYLMNETWSIKGGYSRMNQYMHLLSNTGIGLPTDLWVPATEEVSPMRADQWALGTTKDFDKRDWSLTLEGYYKKMNNVLSYKEGASFLNTGVLDEESEISWQDNVTSGKGESYGAELLLQKPTGKLSGWIGYTLAWTKLQFDALNNGKPFFARYDRRHDFSAVAIYEVSEHITISGTWVYGTGQAITLPNANYNVLPHDPNSASGFLGGYGDQWGLPGYYDTGVQDFGDKNSFRMASYHRLDVAVQFHKQLERAKRTIEVGLYNAYNRRNPFFYEIRTTSSGRNYLSQISLFPVIPSISWNYQF